MTTKKYIEQWLRVKRLLQRFEAIGAGIDHVQESPNYDDDVYSFFQNCYHLKDWIKNDAYCAKWQNVESFISGNQDLRMCADLCNAQKHLVLKTSRSPLKPQISGAAITLNINETLNINNEGAEGTSIEIVVQYDVATTQGKIDALDLARKCVSAWDSFIKANDP